jgi:O-antigen ligase
LSQRLDIMDAIRNELLLGIICLIFAINVLVRSPLSLGPGRQVAISYGVFLVIVVIQVPFAMDPVAAWDMFNDAVLKQAIFVFFVAVLLRSPRHVALFIATYLFALLWIYQEAVRGLITGNLVWYNQGIMRLHGGVDRYRHPNGLGLAGLSCLPLLYYMRRVWRRRWMQLAILLCLVLAVLCIVYSGSRTGYVGVVAVLLVIWVTSRHKVRNLLLIVVFALLASVAMPEQYLKRFETIGGEEIEGASQDARILLMRDAWGIFLQYPYGIGVDSFIFVRLTKYGNERGRQDVHNLYLQILTHLGIQGLIAFVWMIITLFRCQEHSIRCIDDAAAGLRKGLGTGRVQADRYVARYLLDLRTLEMSIRSVRFFIIIMLFDGLFAHTVYHILWCFIVGVTLATATMAKQLHGVTRQFWQLAQNEAA